MNTYEAYIKSEKWTIKREARKQLDSFKCIKCGCSEGRLEVHHKTYEHFMNEPMEDLETLCIKCHDVETDRMRRERYLAKWETRKFEYEQREAKTPLILGDKAAFPNVIAHKDDRPKI